MSIIGDATIQTPHLTYLKSAYKLIVSFFQLFQKRVSFRSSRKFLINSEMSGLLVSNRSEHCNTSLLQVSHHLQPIYHFLPFQTPRLIFQMTQPDPNTEFFIAYFSQDGRRFTLVNPPNHIELSLGARLRSALPNKILSDNAVEEYTRVIEIKRKPNSNGQFYRFYGLTLFTLYSALVFQCQRSK